MNFLDNHFEKYLTSDWINKNENISIVKYTTDQPEQVHTHEFIEIEYVWHGKGVQKINNKDYSVVRGDLLFLNFGDSHSFMPDGEIGMFNCILTPQFVSQELINSQNAMDILALSIFDDFSHTVSAIMPRMQLAGKDLLEMESLLDSMYEEFTAKMPGYLTVLNGYLNVLLARLFRLVKASNHVDICSDINKIAPEVLKYIEENYDKKLSLKELAGICFFNPSYFSKVFKDCFGKTVTEYVTEKRFNAAIKLLKERSDTIEAISYAVGYKDKKQLYRLFREYTGTTPERYREQIKKNATHSI